MKTKTMRTTLKGLGLTLALGLAACAQPQNSVLLTNGQEEGIVGGRHIDPSSPMNKHVVGLYGITSEGGFICTGSLISTNIILTAAHCVEAERLFVVFSPSIEQTLKDKNMNLIRQVTARSIHPTWNKSKIGKSSGDIALIKFAGTTPSGFTPAQLLPSAAGLVPGVLTQMVGYGLDNPEMNTGSGVLRTGLAPILDPRYSATEITIDQRPGRGVCSGDSGGPAFMVISGTYYVWGVASAVTMKPKCREFGIYTNAVAYRDWIRENIALLAFRGNTVPSTQARN